MNYTTNSNLEFRKIKSLKYLYEVNENGTIIRNVKSKKQSKIVLDMHHSKVGCYKTTVRIGNEIKRVMIHKVVAECWLGDYPNGYEVDHIDRNPHNNDYRNLRYVTHSEQMKSQNYSLNVLAKPIKIKKGKEELTFRSMTKCAEYLATKYNVKVEAVRWKLRKKRKHIYDYDISYLNVETGHINPTG